MKEKHEPVTWKVNGAGKQLPMPVGSKNLSSIGCIQSVELHKVHVPPMCSLAGRGRFHILGRERSALRQGENCNKGERILSNKKQGQYYAHDLNMHNQVSECLQVIFATVV